MPDRLPNDCRSNGNVNALTCIRGCIHCATTTEADGLNGHDQIERVDIENFLSTIADVAVSVVRREQQREDNEGGSLH